jgi:hypothetical protein
MPDHKSNPIAYTYTGKVKSLHTPVELYTGEYTPGKTLVVDALWDTGAMVSVITPDVQQTFRLITKDTMLIKGVNGISKHPVVIISLMFPNGEYITNVRAAVLPLTAPTRILIGMDIIGQMDFAITSGKGFTTFSYAHPPFENKFDFTKWAEKEGV